jgi:uncharacterized 2Fe-2S/4Fe-4S cluster protein (DUF4445 family)
MLQHVLGVRRVPPISCWRGFGNYLDPSAVRIGLIPPTAGAHLATSATPPRCAQLALWRCRAGAGGRLARSIEHLSLATHPDFQDLFVEAMNFPKAVARALASGESAADGNRKWQTSPS